MQKWCYIKDIGYDEMLTVFDNKEEAMKYGRRDFEGKRKFLFDPEGNAKHLFIFSLMVGLFNVEYDEHTGWHYAKVKGREEDDHCYEVGKVFFDIDEIATMIKN